MNESPTPSIVLRPLARTKECFCNSDYDVAVTARVGNLVLGSESLSRRGKHFSRPRTFQSSPQSLESEGPSFPDKLKQF
jgi:hypothetical protein